MTVTSCGYPRCMKAVLDTPTTPSSANQREDAHIPESGLHPLHVLKWHSSFSAGSWRIKVRPPSSLLHCVACCEERPFGGHGNHNSVILRILYIKYIHITRSQSYSIDSLVGGCLLLWFYLIYSLICSCIYIYLYIYLYYPCMCFSRFSELPVNGPLVGNK